MIEITVQYFPPVGSGEEAISIARRLSCEEIRSSNLDLFAMVCAQGFDILQANSPELRRELSMTTS